MSQSTDVSVQMVAPGRARVSLTSPMRLLAEGASTPSPLAPQEQDFLYLDVRALSAVLIQSYWLDHSDEKIMRAAVPLLARMPVLLNHSCAAAAFTARCQKCGAEVPIRSSLEAPADPGAGSAAPEHKIPIYG